MVVRPIDRSKGVNVMRAWQEDMLTRSKTTVDRDGIFARMEVAAQALGFEYCAYGIRAPIGHGRGFSW
jgi:hypothetical protein